jgi:hypothetical protein
MSVSTPFTAGSWLASDGCWYPPPESPDHRLEARGGDSSDDWVEQRFPAAETTNPTNLAVVVACVGCGLSALVGLFGLILLGMAATHGTDLSALPSSRWSEALTGLGLWTAGAVGIALSISVARLLSSVEKLVLAGRVRGSRA